MKCSILAPVPATLVALLVVPSTAVAQQEGFITTRADCVPGVQQTINYLQGPDPILDEEGNLHIFVDAGECCASGNWEGIFNLYYPAAFPPSTPRFFALWGANNFGTQPARNEHEAPFPSLFEASSTWHVAYTATFRPPTATDRDRLGRLDLASPFEQVPPSAVDNTWIEPIDPDCRPIGACSGPGSGVLGTAVRDALGILYVYHPDGNYPSCASGWVRHRVEENLTVANPNGDDGCLSFDGMPTAPSLISDIAMDQGGGFHLLVGHNGAIDSIQEWTSTDGLTWSVEGTPWVAPPHPDAEDGWVYSVWDAGFLKNDRRVIIEPVVVVAQISSGRTYEEIVDASLGRFYLYYWASPGASLPPNFGAAAHACDTFDGNVDEFSCASFNGWVWDNTYPDYPTSLDVFEGSELLLQVPANLFRQDLLDAGIGDGFHAFVSPLPINVFDGEPHTLTVKALHSSHVLTGGQFSITCDDLIIFIDGFESGDTSAWS